MDCLSACRVLLVPARREMFGSLIIEGMAMGKPVVASSFPPFREIVEDGSTGFVSDTQDIHEFKEKSELAWNDRRVGTRAEAHASREYAWASRAAEFDKVYEELHEGWQ